MIEVKNVTKFYESAGIRTQVLFDITFKIERGEFVVIMGPSGSGKSTLMHILGALDLPTSGTYILNNKNVENMNDEELAEIRNKEIGFIFQSYNLLPRISALKNVLLPLSYGKVPKYKRLEIGKEKLKMVGLGDKENSNPNQLSGGQKQRVAIARALTMAPSILLADEPTGNLPTQQSDEIIDLFEELNKKGHTVVIITHNDAIAKRTRRIINLVDGKILEDKQNQ